MNSQLTVLLPRLLLSNAEGKRSITSGGIVCVGENFFTDTHRGAHFCRYGVVSLVCVCVYLCVVFMVQRRMQTCSSPSFRTGFQEL